jgi:hypothetical protein
MVSSSHALAKAPEPESEREKKQREPEIDGVHAFNLPFERRR